MKVHLSHLMVVLRLSAVAASNLGLQVAAMLSCITALAKGAFVCTVFCTCGLLKANVLSATYCFSCLAEYNMYNI